MAILGPKIYRFGLGTLILSRGMIFLIFRIFMSNLNGLCDFYRDPDVGINLPRLGEPGLQYNHSENPKVFRGSFKTLCSIIRASPPHNCKRPFSLNLAAG
jgi:hypothetical protein